MAFRDENGNYEATDGTKFGNVMDADAHSNRLQDAYTNASNSGGAGGGGFIGGLAGAGGAAGNAAIAAIVVFILAIPAILAKIFSAVFAFLSKLWIFGKLFQTAFFGLFCVAVLINFFGVSIYMPPQATLLLAISIFAISGLWFWLFHHDEIKTLSIKEYSNTFTISFAILFYGYIICNFVITAIVAVLVGGIAERIVFNIVTFGVILAAALVYLAKTKSCREDAAAIRKHPRLKKTFFTVMVIGIIAVTIPGMIILIETAKAQWLVERPQVETNIDSSLNGIGHYKFASVRIKAAANSDSEDIGRIPAGEFFTIKERAGRFVKVDYKGTEGYVQRASTKQLNKNRFAEANKHTRIGEAPDPNANSKHITKGTHFVLLGENVNGFVKVDFRGEIRWIRAADLKW